MKAHACPSREFRLLPSVILQRCYLALTVLLILIVLLAPLPMWQKGILACASLLSIIFLWISWRRMGEVAVLAFEDGGLQLCTRDGQRIAVLPLGHGVVSAWWVLFSCCDENDDGLLTRWFGVSARHFVVLPDAMADADDFHAFRVAVSTWMRARSDKQALKP